MKRIYITLGLLLAFSMGSFAQNADLAAYLEFTQFECLNVGDTIQPYDTVTTAPYGIWGAINLGPDAIDSNETIWMSTPYNQIIDSGLYFSGYYTDYAAANQWVRPISYLAVDSIHTLLDIDAWENDTNRYYINLMVPKENLVDGERYGFYVFVKGVGDDFNSPDNLDTSRANNNDYVAITWHCEDNTPDGIRGMLDESSRSIDIFPNPAQNDLHFKYGFIGQTDNAIARVIDMTGRVILTKNLGKHHFGTKEFSMDISSLRAGNYLLELSTGYVNAVGKFTVTK